MFNSPILDVAIGLVFIFLLYSLLATSVKEAIATVFSLRARMLKKGIVKGMLSNTPPKWENIVVGLGEGVETAMANAHRQIEEKEKRLGDNFYDHPIIKNYGSSALFPLPSYLPSGNFSIVLMDILKQDFEDKLDAITNYKKATTQTTDDTDMIRTALKKSTDGDKIRELLDYYSSFNAFANAPINPPNGIIDNDTLAILQMHLRNSLYNAEAFAIKLETWFNDSMDRVSGWYKRQVQLILFMIGLVMAMTFNVDTLQIADKLTTDKDARDKIVQLAVKSADQYKDDPRVRKTITSQGNVILDPADSIKDSAIFMQYQTNITQAKQDLDGSIDSTKNLLAIGWGDFGRESDSGTVIHSIYKERFETLFKQSLTEDSTHVYKNRMDTLNARKTALFKLYNDEHWLRLKIGYVVSQTFKGKKFLGFLILAFAVCLGAPFWFDLLNKFIKLRTTGAKQDGNGAA